jgi:hypothetical protein
MMDFDPIKNTILSYLSVNFISIFRISKQIIFKKHLNNKDFLKFRYIEEHMHITQRRC